MNKKQLNEQNERDEQSLTDALIEFANQHSLTRLKVEGYYFVKEFRLNLSTNEWVLYTNKAIVRCYGKVTRVSIGENHKYKTYEEAEKAIKAYWSNYFKERRARMTQAERAGYARRQKQYREQRRREKEAFERRQ